jgi:T-lymphoma invasion and metastasis-inducing protein 1
VSEVERDNKRSSCKHFCSHSLILASALQNTTTTSTASSINNSESNDKNNSLTLDCCCVLVQITPVATGKGSQPASIADGTKKHGDGISGRANGAAPICRCSSAVANHVSTREKSEGAAAVAASSATPSTSKSVTGQSFGAKSRSGSLDQLLFLTDQLAAQTIQRQENRHTGRREITADDLFNYLKDINGDLKFVDKKKLAQLLLQNTETIVAQQHHQQQQSVTGTIRKHAPASRQESTGETKQIHFVNHSGPTPTPSIPIDAPTKGILQTRKSNSGSKFGKCDAIDIAQQKEFSDEWLNRSHFQRTSSRSAETSTMPKPDDSAKRHHKHHQRHFSGPEDLEALKKDITHWLERLPYKKDAALLDLMETAAKMKHQQHHTSSAKPKSIIKNEFADIIRPPLPQKQRQQQLQAQQQPPPLPLKQFQRQKSADDLRVLKNNILEWLTKQQIMNQQRLLQQQQQQHMVPLKSAILDMKPDLKSSTAPPPLPRKTHQKLHKRHSLGPSDTSSDFHEIPDWIQIPIDKLNKMREVQKSCSEMSRKGSGKERSQERVHHKSAERRELRHSASEVVQSNVDRNYQKHNQPPQPSSSQVQYQMIQHSQPPLPIQTASTSHHFVQQQLPQTSSKPQVQYQVVQRYREPNSTLKSEKTLHHSHHGHGHGHSGGGGSSSTDRPSKRDKPRHHRQTQRSATTGNILQNKHQQQVHHQQISIQDTTKPIYQSTTSLVRCDDPMCPLLPICTDPNCYLNANSHYDTPRRASLPPHSNEMPPNDICTDPRCCEVLPLCTDPRCCGTIAAQRSKSKANGVSAQQKFKSNSLPRCVESTRRSDLFLPGLSKDESYSSLPKSATLSSATAQVTAQHKAKSKSPHHRNGNNKLMKSASAASLHSRRRRHKTVHFGENLLREVCQNRQLIRPLTDQPSNSSTPSLQPNIQMLYNFVEGVLSAWVDEEEDDNIKSGPDSEPERGAALKPMHRCNRARMQTIRRITNEAAALKGTLKLGNSRYRHRHWRGTAKDCNERFLRKVIFNVCVEAIARKKRI